MNSNMIYFNGVIYMDMYKTAYFHLFNQISDLIEALQQMQREGEELVISCQEEGQEGKLGQGERRKQRERKHLGQGERRKATT